MKAWCESCSGKGYDEYPDYDWDENLLDEGMRVKCDDCNGEGYTIDSTIQRMAGYISTFDIDEDICKKQTCRLIDDEVNRGECIDCIIDFFHNECKWEHDEFCVNDKSEWVADFAYPSRCGRCKYYERSK